MTGRNRIPMTSGVGRACDNPTLGQELEGLFMGPIKEHAKELADVLRKEFGEPVSCVPVNIPISDVLTFHRLNGLNPTIQSCTFKLIEELGEFLQIVGKHSGMSGEKPIISDEVRIRRMIFEALDVAQSAVTMVYTLCELKGVLPELFVEAHERKLRQKGYLREVNPCEK